MKVLARIFAFLGLIACGAYFGLVYLPVGAYFGLKEVYVQYFTKCALYAMYVIWSFTLLFVSFAKCHKHHAHEDHCCCCHDGEGNEEQPKRRVNSIKAK